MAEKMGRKTKLTPETTQLIVDAVKAGNFLGVSAVAAGINEKTFYLWMQEGEAAYELTEEASAEDGFDQEKFDATLTQRQRLCRDFFQAITRARAEAQASSIVMIRKHAKDDWRAAAWFLERSFPKQFGKRMLPPIADDRDPSFDDGRFTMADLLAVAEAAGDDNV